VPAAGRGRVFGLAQADIIVQGAAILLAGGAGQHVTPALVVAGAGGFGHGGGRAAERVPSPCGPDWEGWAAQLRPT